MTSVTQNRITIAVALWLPLAAMSWLLTQSSAAVAATFVAVAALTLATAVVALNTWKRSQPTRSVGQLIYEMEIVPASTPNAPPAVTHTSAERWAAWRSREEALDETGRVRALLALSIVGTLALLCLWRV
jgi:hypothetical protein